MNEVILVINAGSSTIKFSIFTCTTLSLLYHGEVDHIPTRPRFILYDQHHQISEKFISTPGYQSAFSKLFDWLKHLSTHLTIKAVGHRVVHGGNYFFSPTLITTETIDQLSSLIPLAPLHQPHNLAAITSIRTLYPTLTQVACFDTSFHQTQPKLATLFALPKELTNEHIIRYGFHGLSYEYIAEVLPEYISNQAEGKIIVAHLGHGASMCAMEKRKSVATSMGFTALDGLMMGTRCGTIDPGVILYLLQERKFTMEQINHLLYQESGLLGISGISSDMRELQSSTDADAIMAVELFCYKAIREIGALCAVLQGCDAIIFTAGIGQKSVQVRHKICEQLGWLGVNLDVNANERNATIISKANTSITVGLIPTNEEYMIAKHTTRFI